VASSIITTVIGQPSQQSIEYGSWSPVIDPLKAEWDQKDTLLQVLDSLQESMEGGGHYSRSQYSRFKRCFVAHPPLAQSQEMLWQGIIHYASKGGSKAGSRGVAGGVVKVDAWGKNPSQFSERNATRLRYNNIMLYEPCNFASNLAYYEMSKAVCEYAHWTLPPASVRALIQSSAGLAAGSAFYHGSHTKLGQLLDNFMISVVSYIVHQASLAALDGLPPELTDLAPSRRPLTAVQISEKMVRMFSEQPVELWFHKTLQVDIPDYMTTFSATYCTIFSLVLPEALVDWIVPALIDVFAVPPDMKQFVMDRYLPLVRIHLTPIKLSFFQTMKLWLSILSATKKLMFAFLWQEDIFKVADLKKPSTIKVGGLLQPYVNSLSSTYSWLPVLSPNLARGSNIYPGESWCKRSQSHSLWHAQSAAGLLDYFLVSDIIYKYTLQINQ